LYKGSDVSEKLTATFFPSALKVQMAAHQHHSIPNPSFIPFSCHTASLFSLCIHPIPSSCIFFLTIFPLIQAFFKASESLPVISSPLPPTAPHFISYHFADLIYFTI
jgi:hypothetical protein